MSGMSCQHCQSESPAGAKFCIECGARLVVHIPHGTLPRLDAYGYLVGDMPGGLVGEHKQITVLFADVKSSMELIADRDPEDAFKFLSPVLDRMMESVHRYEGTTSSVRGDGILALFGAPFAHEDHAVRACYAALRMQETVRRFAQEIQRSHGVPIQIRIGLHSGEALVCAIGNDVRRGYTAIGHTVHLAARMEQSAMPGSILLTRSTLRLAEGYIQTRALGRLHVKGLADGVEAFELTGTQAARSRLQAASMRGLSQFVGRGADVCRIATAWGRAAAGQGQIVAIVGEPGVGKSRLILEFVRSRANEAWRIIETGSVSHGPDTANLPMVELLRSYFRINDRDAHPAIREKVDAGVLALDPALKAIVPALLSLLDTPPQDAEWDNLDPELRRGRTHDAIKQLLLRTSQIQPLLIVFEDLHGIDSETQQILNHVIQCLPLARILLLGSYRPGYQHGWQSLPCYTEIHVGPLAPEGTESLLDALLGNDFSLPPLKRLLAERTAGNPFFIEESVRSFVEANALVGTQGAYHFAGSLTAIQVPSTVQPVIAERIDRLAPTHKQLLQAAAVIGTNVPSAVLHAVVDLPDETVREGLARLQALDYLHEAGLFPEPEYAFKHALTHEVAYNSLLHDRRRYLHARIVEAIERLYADRIPEQVERLSFHAVSGEVWDKAVSYCYQAGAKAAAKSAHHEAVARYTAALEAIERLPQDSRVMRQAFDLRFSLRTSLSPLGEFQRSFELLHEAEAIATTLHDQARLARVFTFKALYFWSIGQQDRAIEASAQALVAAQPVGDVPAQMLAHLFAGRARHARGDYAQAIDLMNEVIEVTDADRTNFFGMANMPSVSARAWLSWSLAERGEFDLALRRCEEAVYIAEAVDHLVSRIYAYMGLGIVHLRQGRLAPAIQQLERAYQMTERADLRMARATVAGYLGRAYTLNDQLALAIDILRDAVGSAAGMELMVDQATRLVHLAEATLHAGDAAEATRLAHLGLRNAQDYHQRGTAGWAQWLLGEIAARADNGAAAKDHYQQAMAIASELGMAPLLADCHYGLARCLDRAGETARSRTHLHTAREAYRLLGMPSRADDPAIEQQHHL